MATSALTLVRKAVVALGDADITLRALCGRSTDLVVAWRSLATAKLPATAVLVASTTTTGGAGDRRRVQVLLGGFARGTGAQDTAEAIVQRWRELLTPAAFQSRGLDAAAVEFTDRAAWDPDEDPAQDGRADLDVAVLLTAP